MNPDNLSQDRPVLPISGMVNPIPSRMRRRAMMGVQGRGDPRTIRAGGDENHGVRK
jgi:hypothetical protein